jgi:class III poly(R)-hydroxyalkanoic acid synthase PhaE subunit
MDLEYPKRARPEPLLAAWIKWTMDFWETMAQMGPGLSGSGASGGASSQADASVEDSCPSVLKLWQAFFSLLTEPGTVDAVFKEIQAPSEVVLKMAQAGWGGYFHLYQQWLEGVQAEGKAAEPYGFENLDQDIFKICTEIYESDFRQLLNMPQVGLTRLSQEGINRAMDRFAQFQAAMAEFVYLLYLPLKKSLRAMPQDVNNGEAGKAGEDFKDYYKKWLKLLEGYYMTLFKSPEYTRTMSHTLEALEDFALAKQELLAEALAALAVPTRRDMDELYREIYLLKKQVKDLSKKVSRLQPAT